MSWTLPEAHCFFPCLGASSPSLEILIAVMCTLDAQTRLHAFSALLFGRVLAERDWFERGPVRRCPLFPLPSRLKVPSGLGLDWERATDRMDVC